MPLPTAIPKDVRKLLAFGSGVGIEIGAADLEVAVARVRPSKIQVLGRITIANFAGRPAAEWGAEYAHLLKSLGASHLSATVLLPRREVIVRQVSLPGVASKDIENAIGFQLDTLHPYVEDEVVWGWSPLGGGAALVGIARRETVDRYHQLFTEAGVAVHSFTFSAAAVHAAIRLDGFAVGNGFVALGRSATGAVEVYGESTARPVFSAEFDMAPQRATVLALSELRLPPDTAPMSLEEVLPKPSVNPVENDLSRNALPYATALAGACPRLAPAANVLPPEHRRFSSRAAFIPTLVMGGLVLLALIAVAVYSSYSDSQYRNKLAAEIARIEPQAQRAAALDRRIDQSRARALLLDEFRLQTKSDLDALNELTRLIEPPAWTNAIDLTHDTVRVSGEAPQASTLLKILDASRFFDNSTPQQIGKSGSGGEVFQIQMSRRNHK
jgi:Tfp pilus assembly protein PilN